MPYMLSTQFMNDSFPFLEIIDDFIEGTVTHHEFENQQCVESF